MEELNETLLTIPWKESILDEIRERPGIYLGLKSLTALWFFLHGYELGRFRSEHRWPSEVPAGFADWVAYRLHLSSNWSGFWLRAILSKVRDEALALDRFFELRDEMARREAKVVATIWEDRREHRIGKRLVPGGEFVECTELLPKSLKIVVYTDDPGFFLETSEAQPSLEVGKFVAALDSNEANFGDRFAIIDDAVWSRLLVENQRYKRNLKRTQLRTQKKGEQKLRNTSSSRP